MNPSSSPSMEQAAGARSGTDRVPAAAVVATYRYDHFVEAAWPPADPGERISGAVLGAGDGTVGR